MVQFLIPLNTMLISLIYWFSLAVNLWFLICNVDQSVDQFNNTDPPSILCKYLNLIYYLNSILRNFSLPSINSSTRSTATVIDNISINQYKLSITLLWYNQSFTCVPSYWFKDTDSNYSANFDPFKKKFGKTNWENTLLLEDPNTFKFGLRDLYDKRFLNL